MSFLSAILLGILQGLTEFIPVSSSGHLVLSQYFFGIGDSANILFELFMHLGTLLAVLVFFRNTLWDLIKSVFSWKNTMNREIHRQNRCMVLYLILSTLATAVIYFLFGDTFKTVYDNAGLVAGLLLATGGMIFVSDYLVDRGIPASNMGFWRAILIGLGQGIAILPGISRSGTTITASLATGMKRKDAAQFSFLMSIPAILAANLSEWRAFLELDIKSLHSYLAGFGFAFVTGYIVIAFLIRLIQSNRLKYFAIYCWLVGSISLMVIYL